MDEFYEAILPQANRLYRHALRLTQNDRDAEDLVQDTMLRAYTKFEQYESGTSPLAWLMVIQRSIFINKYRKKKREGHQISLDEHSPAGERLTPGDLGKLPESPEAFLFRNVLDAELKEALSQLQQHYLEVILLVDLEDMSYREVSEVLNIPAGTVMSRLHRARKTLQGKLQDLAQKKGIIKGKVEPLYRDKENKDSGGKRYGS